jgi:AraC-like DNA-binding protein
MRAFPEQRSYASELPVFGGEVAGFDFLAHWHPDVELVHVLQGQITVGVGDQRARLGPGDLAVIASNEIHYYQREGAASRMRLVIFRPEAAGYPGIWPDQRRLASAYWRAGQTGAVPELLARIVAEDSQDDGFRHRVLRGLVTQLGGWLDRDFTTAAEPATGDRGPLRLRLAEAISFIRSGFQTDLTLEGVARHVNLSPSYFSRSFQACCGTGFKTYLNALRVEHAERLLASTNRTILDIALECGFSSPRGLHRAFGRHRGLAPSGFRGLPF